MRVEELSVGDWVFHLAEMQAGRISHIYRTGGIYSIGLDCADCVVICGINDIAPISLTPEILEKNGLMRVSEEDGYEAYCCNDFLIRRSKFSCTDWWQVDVHYKQYVAHLSGYIQYVHQLQRLLTINECDKEIEV